MNVAGSGSTERALRAALTLAIEYIHQRELNPVGAPASVEELRRRLLMPLPLESSDPVAVLHELARSVDGGLARSTGGRFFGWVIGGVTPASLAADWMTGVWDQNAGMYEVSPAAAVVEEACGKWLIELLGLPKESSFALVTGCQMAHVTCLAAARNSLLSREGWDVERDGLYAAPRLRVISSSQRHGSIERALRILGMGSGSVTDIDVGDDGVLSGAALEAALEDNRNAPRNVPTIVLLQAGDLNTGYFDDFDELIPIARKHGAWVHVDGAFGMWAATSKEHSHWVSGIGKADSWATDGHKWLNVPYDCGYAFVRDRTAHYASLGHKASYLIHSKEARDPIDWTPEYSRRARGFATYAAIASLGREGIGNIVDSCCEHARTLVDAIGALPGVSILQRPTINQGLLRFLDRRPGAAEAEHDAMTDAVTKHIVASGEAFFACTTWHGMRAMRISVSDWNTTSEKVARVVTAVETALRDVAKNNFR
ncbi:MAG: pyridoxal-dependent decarboxylase [Pseudomonadota bacterium]